MAPKTDVNMLLELLRKEEITTWFDLGLFIDRFKEANEISERGVVESYSDFTKRIDGGGIGFITFQYMVDGVTVETGKYASLFEMSFPGMPIHFIAGGFRNRSESFIKGGYKRKTIGELKGFNEWDLYEDFFMEELERGSKKYNELIYNLWRQTLTLLEKLGNYIEQENIQLLYLINICSNPGNVAAALALVLLSEYLQLPVINNNHDFYFEGGNSKYDKKSKGLKNGPRDLFYTNAHLGEIFSLIEILYPWESKYWLNVNINRSQSDYLVRYKGHNPGRIHEIGTAVDTTVYSKKDKRRNINAILQLEKILARYKSRLIAYSVDDVEENELVSESNPSPILIGNKTRALQNFSAENIIFLQPTRIISRKRIELGFSLLQKLFDNQEMSNRLNTTPNLKITLLVSGPVASGHFEYYKKIIRKFKELLEEIPGDFKDRVFLALLLGELDKDSFLEKFEDPIDISNLYNIASLILLPSKTEGRGLPIIEAAACGTPIFCRRYEPEVVFSEVIGEHLGEDDRLKVFEFSEKKISGRIVGEVTERVFFPHKYTEETNHNKHIIDKRYSLEALKRNITGILRKLHTQLQPGEAENKIVSTTLEEYEKKVSFRNKDLSFLIRSEHRQYIPGYGRLAFMLMLKSLIDPSFFRVEQQRIRGSVFYFAKEMLHEDSGFAAFPEDKVNAFYNAVDHLFHYVDGEVAVLHDHSMAYRHRNRNNYPYQKYTFQELTGLVNLLYIKVVEPEQNLKINLSPQFFTDWNLALLQLTGSNYLAIDNRDQLIQKLKANLPIAYFPGEFIMYELEFFALQAIRSRLQLGIEQEISRDLLDRKKNDIAPVFIFAQEKKLGKQLNRREIEKYIETGISTELQLLYEFKLVQIVTTEQVCVGIHFPQLGEYAIKTLRRIGEQGGFLLTNRRHAALMTDIVNMDRFHIGRVRGDFAANIMGIPLESGFIQYVPAGLRATLSYPTPVQTAMDLNRVLQSDLYVKLVQSMGENTVKEVLVKDAERRGSPAIHVLKRLENESRGKKTVNYHYISGLYDDGNPYNGVYVKINLHKHPWKFSAVNTKSKPLTVSEFVKEFEQSSGKIPLLAWNGGYILNAELVGKLGLSESYIGSPLGMLITDGRCLSPPLFNKAALLIDSEGRADIRLVNCSRGIVIQWKNHRFELTNANYNNKDPVDDIAFYDLMYPEQYIPGNGRIIVRFSGRTVTEIIQTESGEDVKVVPVGITVTFPGDIFPKDLVLHTETELTVTGFEDISQAVEAGPLLLNNGKESIDMEAEGWKHRNSIATQAARLDYTDMRGPKIAVGLSEKGEMVVLTVNGRIRESVGATHNDMANILAGMGMVKAMGFDPGGSSTLYADGKTLNISPYNQAYEYNVYALPPQSRAVSNAVIVSL
jgi:glycosyltransferase involved in cell wall biosynthesis